MFGFILLHISSTEMCKSIIESIGLNMIFTDLMITYHIFLSYNYFNVVVPINFKLIPFFYKKY
jgi:hypothetical protein